MSISNLEIRSMFAGLELEGVDSNVLAGLSKHLQAVERITTEHASKVARINASPNFTAAGKSGQIGELEEATRNELERVRVAASGYGDHIEQLQQQLTPKTQ